MELRQIRLFMAVAEERHFGRAAEKMFIAQPALSQHVRRLERELGVELFDRSGRQVRLTPAGEAFLEVARRMWRQVDEAAVAARRAEAGEAGSLGLGVHLAVAAPVLSVLLRHWSRLRPAVRPRLTSGRPGELVDLVRRRELDVALVDGPVSDLTLNCAVVVEDHLVLVLPADHPLAQQETVELRHLRAEPFVAVARRGSASLHDRFIELCRAAGFSPQVTLEVDDPDLLPFAVAAGLGVGLVPSVSVAAQALPGLVCRPVAGTRAVLPLVAISARHGVTAQTRDFLHLVENLHHASPLLPVTTVDLTNSPGDEPVRTWSAPRVLQKAV